MIVITHNYYYTTVSNIAFTHCLIDWCLSEFSFHWELGGSIFTRCKHPGMMEYHRSSAALGNTHYSIVYIWLDKMHTQLTLALSTWVAPGAHKRKERSTPIVRVVISKCKLRRLARQKTSLYGSFLACGHKPTGSFYVMNSFLPAAYKEGSGLVTRKTAANRSLLLVNSTIKVRGTALVLCL